MLRTQLSLIALFLTGLVPVGHCIAADPHLLDQRDPAYQKAINHIANAQQALAVAQRELELARAAHPLPGVDTDLMARHLRPVEDTLSMLLTPERKRLARHVIVPDGDFFTPVKVGD